MEDKQYLDWDIGTHLAKHSLIRGHCVRSPTIRTKDGAKWTLTFYPSGDGGESESLVFWIVRSVVDRRTRVRFELQLCHQATPVKSYTFEKVFEKGELLYKWYLADISSVAQLKIFVPLGSLRIFGVLKVRDL